MNYAVSTAQVTNRQIAGRRDFTRDVVLHKARKVHYALNANAFDGGLPRKEVVEMRE